MLIINHFSLLLFNYHKDDINWFKPVDLWTKKGKLGRIKEPLGTHGYFKVLMNHLFHFFINLSIKKYSGNIQWSFGSG